LNIKIVDFVKISLCRKSLSAVCQMVLSAQSSQQQGQGRKQAMMYQTGQQAGTMLGIKLDIMENPMTRVWSCKTCRTDAGMGAVHGIDVVA
jgi:hypothetical protein